MKTLIAYCTIVRRISAIKKNCNRTLGHNTFLNISDNLIVGLRPNGGSACNTQAFAVFVSTKQE